MTPNLHDSLEEKKFDFSGEKIKVVVLSVGRPSDFCRPTVDPLFFLVTNARDSDFFPQKKEKEGKVTNWPTSGFDSLLHVKIAFGGRRKTHAYLYKIALFAHILLPLFPHWMISKGSRQKWRAMKISRLKRKFLSFCCAIFLPNVSINNTSFFSAFYGVVASNWFHSVRCLLTFLELFRGFLIGFVTFLIVAFSFRGSDSIHLKRKTTSVQRRKRNAV